MQSLFSKFFETATDTRARLAVEAVESHCKLVTVEAMRLLAGWLVDESARADQDHDGLVVLNAINAPLQQLMSKVLSELLDAYTNHARSQLILQATLPFCAAMLEFYARAIPREVELLSGKASNIELIQTAIANWLYWLERDHVARFFRDPEIGRIPWQDISPTVAFALSLSDKQSAKAKAANTAMTLLQNRLAHLVLLSRTLSRDLQGRQLLIADLIADKLAGFTLISHQHSTQTPFGQAGKSDNPPTILTQSPTLATLSDKRLFYGLEGSMRELEHLEHVILGLQKLPDEFDATGRLTVAETLAVIKHLKSRWGRQRIRRLAERRMLSGTLDLAYDFAALRRLLLQSGQVPPPRQTEVTIERVEIDNVSSTGAGLKLRRGTLKKRLTWLKLGAVVAIKTDGMRSWRLGILRRVVSSVHDEINIGVQFLSANPEAVELARRVASVQGDGALELQVGDKIPAIYLPPESLNNQQPVLACRDSELEVGKTYLTTTQDGAKTLRIKAIFEITTDGVFYACELVA